VCLQVRALRKTLANPNNMHVLEREGVVNGKLRGMLDRYLGAGDGTEPHRFALHDSTALREVAAITLSQETAGASSTHSTVAWVADGLGSVCQGVASAGWPWWPCLTEGTWRRYDCRLFQGSAVLRGDPPREQPAGLVPVST
jgi:hypothetical protein